MSSWHEEPAKSRPRRQFPDLIALGRYRGEPAAYVRDWLGPVLDFDTERGARLAAILRAYLDSWGNYLQTARTLAIHTSTARYRVHRIRSLLDDDLQREQHPIQPPGRHPPP